jgi:hypothetical protein
MDECPICGATGTFERIVLREMIIGTRDRFEYTRCPDCGVLRIATNPTDPHRYEVPEEARPRDDAVSPPRGPFRRLAIRVRNDAVWFVRRRRRLDRLVRRRLPGPARTPADRALVRALGLRSLNDSIVEVGAGRRPGRLRQLRGLGFRNLLAIDPSLDRDETVDGIRLRRLGIGELRGSHQAILLASFGHVADPLAVLRAAERRLGPGGTILVTTPVIGSWPWDRFGTSWSELDAPRQALVHTQRSLERLGRDGGFEVVRVDGLASVEEIVASSQIARDIAWCEPTSWRVHPPTEGEAAVLASFDERARTLQANGTGGRAGFAFRRVGDPALPAATEAPPPGRRSDRPPARPGSAAGPAAAAPTDGVRELIRIQPVRSDREGYRLNLVIPTADPGMAFAGVRTALEVFNAIAADAARVRIVSLAPIEPSVAAAYPGSRILGPSEDSDDAVQLVGLARDPDASLAVRRDDVFVATFWTTADLVIRLRAWQAETWGRAPARFAYLVQDYEPGFYPWSGQSLLARATYDAPAETVAIFNTSLLQAYVHGVGVRFADEFVFEPRLATPLRAASVAPATGPRDPRIVVYGRPGTPRNAFPLIVDGLRAWRRLHEGAERWSLVSAGQEHPDVDLGAGSVLRSIGKLGMDDYAALLRRSAVGVSLMVSPHPSHPPLEMAHLGMLVVTNRFDAKDLSAWHENIASMEPATPGGLAATLSAACARFEADPDVGDRGRALRPEYLSDDPPFPFAAEVAARLRTGVGL